MHVIESPTIQPVCVFILMSADSSQHTLGPLDGSLYATILKSPKTPPERPASAVPGAFPLQHSSGALISPPPEFSNTAIGAHQQLQRSQSCTPAPPQRQHANNNTSSPQRATIHHHQPQARPGSSQSQHTSTSTATHYHNFQPQQQQQRSVSRSSNYTSVSQSTAATNGNGLHGGTADSVHALERGKSIRYAQPLAAAVSATAGDPQQRRASSASSVHSPLTLSMDSGIASSGVTANRKCSIALNQLCTTAERN